MPADANRRTRRSAITWSSGLLATAVSMAVAFITTPLILDALGPERFGAVRALGEWFGHLSLLELGLGGALPPLLARALARHDADRVGRQMAAGIRAYALVALAALAGGLALTVALPRLVPVDEGLVRDLRAAGLVAAGTLLLYPLAPFRALADASQRGWLVHWGLMLQAVLTAVLAVVLARAGTGITGQLLALLAGQAAFTGLVSAHGMARLGAQRRALLRAPGAEPRADLRRLNVPTLLADLSSRVALLSDNIIAAVVLGAGAVAPLFLTQRLLALAGQQLLGIGNASWAALADLDARGDRARFAARLLDLTRLVSGLAMAALVPIAAWNRPFVGLWVGSDVFGGNLVTAVAALNAFLLAVLGLWGWCFGGTGRIAVLAPMLAVSAGVNLLASVLATRSLGLAGPLIGTAVALLGVNAWYVPRALSRTFAVPVAALAAAALRPLLWASPVAAACLWAAHRYPPAGWFALAACMAGAGALLLACWWSFALTADERAEFVERARAAGRKPDA